MGRRAGIGKKALSNAQQPEALPRKQEADQRALPAATAGRAGERSSPVATARAWELLDAPDRLFSVLYADFPWRVEAWAGRPGLLRTADHHYPTMALAEIKTAMVQAAGRQELRAVPVDGQRVARRNDRGPRGRRLRIPE